MNIISGSPGSNRIEEKTIIVTRIIMITAINNRRTIYANILVFYFLLNVPQSNHDAG